MPRLITVNGDEPIFVAIDSKGSMATPDAPGDVSRIAYARARLTELLKRLPKETRVSVLSFDSNIVWHAEGSSRIDARAALMRATPNGAEANHGRVLEWAMMSLTGEQRATLIMFTDGMPADLKRWEAWLAFNERDSDPLHIVVLWLIEPPTHLLHGRTRQDEHTLDEDLEILVHTNSPVHPPTLPTSIAPLDPMDGADTNPVGSS